MTELQTTTAAATMTEVDSTTAAAVQGELLINHGARQTIMHGLYLLIALIFACHCIAHVKILTLYSYS